MELHQATCNCGQPRVVAEGDPVRVLVCHCLACQRRTESAADIVAIPVGAFADPGFTSPTRFVYDDRRHPWLNLPGETE